MVDHLELVEVVGFKVKAIKAPAVQTGGIRFGADVLVGDRE